MTKQEKTFELIRHRDTIFAAIDYILKEFENEPVSDEIELLIEYYEQQKRQTEKYYQAKRLDRLELKLNNFIKLPQGRGDLTFAEYVREKTGYQIDIFESIRNRTDAIIEQGQIKNKKDLGDVAIFFNTYGQHQEYQTKLTTLKTLVVAYGERTRKNAASKNR